MADDSAPGTPSSVTSGTETPGSESKAQRDARLRRERRNAKIQTGGSERLSKITSLSGRPNAAEAELNRTTSKPSTPAGSQRAQGGPADDPAEVDITNMFARPPQNGDPMQDQQDVLRQLLRQPPPGTENEGPGMGGDQGGDPLMQMMQQMLGGQMPGMGGEGMPGAAGQPGGAPPGMPPGLADLLNGQMGGAQAQPASSGDYIWRIVHAFFSILLGLYAVTVLDFNGTEWERRAPTDETGAQGARLFYLFATAEVVLQSTRYFVDKGQLPQSGMMATIAGFLPPPFNNYLRILNRYGVIYTTVSQDVFVVLFVLGAVAWLNGA